MLRGFWYNAVFHCKPDEVTAAEWRRGKGKGSCRNPKHNALWKHLPELIREGRQNAFLSEFDQMAFEYARNNGRYGKVFDEAMSSYSAAEGAWVLEALQERDFSAIEPLCDVGGGRGFLLCSLLARHPHLQGTVLERGQVLEDGERLWGRRG